MRGTNVLAAFLVLHASWAAAQPVRVDLIVASTTDVHGRLRGWDYYADGADTARGLARAATIVDSLRRAHSGRVILVDAGDLLQGNPLTYVAARRDTAGVHPVIAAMNAMGYDAAAVGNHEFNYGLTTLRAAIHSARFPFLAANVVPLGRERNAKPLFSPFRVVERGGVRVGIVGATTPGAMVWDRENLQGRLLVKDIVPSVRQAVREVRRRGAQAVVVVMHSGLSGPSSYDTVATGLPSENVAARVAREVTGVDLIVFGHSHQEVADTTINGVLLVQPRNWATSVAVATLTLERLRQNWKVVRKRGELVRVSGRPEHAGVVAAVERVHQSTVAWVNETLGTTATPWRADSSRVVDTPLIDFILEVERRATGADLAATAAFDLNASLDTGGVTIAEVARLYPYDNTLRAIRITGKQLRAFLEYSARYYRTIATGEVAATLVDPLVPGFNFDIVAGADYTLDLSKPLGQRVTRLEFNGRRVTDADSFTLALSNYRQSGGGGFAMLQGAPVVYDKQEEIRDLLIAEVKRRGELRPADYHRVNWRLAPEGIAAAAYRAMRSLPFDRSTEPRRTPPLAGNEHLATGRWLRVIGTNDFHGGLEPRDYNAEGVVRGGGAYLVSAIKAARAECRPPSCESMWVDGGDQWQGTLASNLTLGRPVTELFNRFGLDAAALGNHEFDWGVDSMRARLRDNAFPVLAANMLEVSGGDVPWMPNDTILTIGALKVGVIGVITTETSRAARASYVSPFLFVNPAPIIDARAKALRRRGVDAVVVVGHIGATCERNDYAVCTGEVIDLANGLTERVDAIVGGHLHRPTAALVRGIPITQAWQKGSGIGVIDVPLGMPGERPRISLRNVRPDSLAADPAAAAFIDSVVSRLRTELSVPVATLGEPLKRGPNGSLGAIVADAFRVMGGGDVAVMNAGGVRIDLAAGPITVGDVFEAQPFANKLVRVQIRGTELRSYLERLFTRRGPGVHLSGARLDIDSTRAPGSRVVRVVMHDGSVLEDRRVYRLVLTDFIAEGGDGLQLTERAVAFDVLPLLDRDALAQYLRQLPQPVRAPTESRVTFLRP